MEGIEDEMVPSAYQGASDSLKKVDAKADIGWNVKLCRKTFGR